MNPVVDLFVKGGPLMWPILTCLVAALAVVAERWLWWWQLRLRHRHATLEEVFAALAEGRFDHATRVSSASLDPFLSTVCWPRSSWSVSAR